MTRKQRISNSDEQKKYALVLGGGIAGLLTARVLSKHFERVTIIEKDPLDQGNAPRKSVPQGHQLHLVLARGLQIMERYLPGLTTELEAGGAVVSNDVALDLCWFSNGGYRPQVPTGLKSVMLTRSFLENAIRRRVSALPQIDIVDGTKVTGLCSTLDRSRVTGVRLAGQPVRELRADLVIDTTGRGSKNLEWLDELGYAKPKIEEVGINIRYATRLYHRPKAFRKLIVVGNQPPHQTRYGVVIPVEADRFMVTLNGRGDQIPPTDEAGFKAYAQSLLTQDITDVLTTAEPISPVMIYNIPKTRWYHYEKLTHFPSGYLVLGDAICQLNPIYGQGMTSAAMQVEVLDKMLAKRPLSDNFWQPYFKQIAKVVGIPWQMTSREDFRFPQTEGTPQKMPGLAAIYVDKLTQTINHDPVVFTTFFNVIHLMKPPTALLHPRIVWRVLFPKGKRIGFLSSVLQRLQKPFAKI